MKSRESIMNVYSLYGEINGNRGVGKDKGRTLEEREG